MPTREERISKRNIKGIITVVRALVHDSELRQRFLDDSPATLLELGVKIEKPEILDNMCKNLREFIEKEIALIPKPEPLPHVRPIAQPVAAVVVSPQTPVVVGSRTLPDPVGSVALGPVATTAVATAVATGVVSGVHSIATSDVAGTPPRFDWKDIKLDFGRISAIERGFESDRRIAELEGELILARLNPPR